MFRDGDEIFLQSRDEKPLGRYFPELLVSLKAQLARHGCVLDGEIVIAQRDRLDFEALQMRLHPAASRVKMLAEKIRRRSCSSTCCARAIETCGASRCRAPRRAGSDAGPSPSRRFI